jgi:Peptidase propeptide and YPEB domain
VLRTHIGNLALSTAMLSLIVVPFGQAGTTHKTKLSMEEARKIAVAKEAGKVNSQELEKEKGRWIYSFDIERDKQIHEVAVDANTGEIVEDSVENAADEMKEKAAENKPQS